MVDKIGKYIADYSPLTPEEIATPIPEVEELFRRSKPINQRFVVRCTSYPYHKELEGQYIKVGGGYTPHLQEAQVIGWTKSSHKKWERGHELIPVTIEKVR